MVEAAKGERIIEGLGRESEMGRACKGKRGEAGSCGGEVVAAHG